MSDIKLGIQLYTLRDHCKTAEDFDKTLEYLSSLGVDTVQISAIGPIPAEEQKRILDKNHMSVCVTHKNLQLMKDDLDALITEHKIIGCDALGLGWAGEDFRGTPENLDKFVALTDGFCKKLKENGMTFNYHNHDFEFKKYENGKTMLESMIEKTDPATFHFIPDVAWIHFAGFDPVEYLYKMKGRVKVIHFKDYNIVDGERKFCTLGDGRVDLKACYKAAKELEIPYIMYEQDCDWVDNDPLLATKLSWEYMNSIAE